MPHVKSMDTDENSQKIKTIYDEAIEKLEALGVERKMIVKDYIAELEKQKIEAIKKKLEFNLSE